MPNLCSPVIKFMPLFYPEDSDMDIVLDYCWLVDLINRGELVQLPDLVLHK